jgi:GTP-binding protein
MNISSAEFLTSSPDHKLCPPPDKPEFAFIGRSNVGKSSLINSLVNRKGLAKTSGTPGKTQVINHFIINNSWYLVDLPGYGYSKTSRENRAKWDTMIRDYLLKRENLLCTLLLIDARLDPQNIDTEFMNWLGENAIPFVIVFTKTDKLTKNQLLKNITHYKKELADLWETLPEIFITSSETGTGKTELLDYIEKIIPLFGSEKN